MTLTVVMVDSQAKALAPAVWQFVDSEIMATALTHVKFVSSAQERRNRWMTTQIYLYRRDSGLPMNKKPETRRRSYVQLSSSASISPLAEACLDIRPDETAASTPQTRPSTS